MFKITGISTDDLSKVSQPICEMLSPGDIYILQGEIGAGKTTLISAIAKQLGIEEEVTSPTFAIVAQYLLPKSENKVKRLIHIDTYRLEHLNELYELGFETLFDETSITFIEWGDRIKDYIDKKHFILSIDEPSPDKRDYVLESNTQIEINRQNQIDKVFATYGWSKT